MNTKKRLRRNPHRLIFRSGVEGEQVDGHREIDRLTFKAIKDAADSKPIFMIHNELVYLVILPARDRKLTCLRSDTIDALVKRDSEDA